jgi:addiction module RelE/StbE family toxin
MQVQYSSTFKKQYKKLPNKLQSQFDQRLQLFLVEPNSPRLRIHPLKGKYFGYWSMSVTGDLRAIYLRTGEELVIFALIGTHSELYG